MFNRNPAVRDSPQDYPREPEEYQKQTEEKIELTILAAASLSPDVFIIPDMGCGVFQNDPRYIGGLLGKCLLKHRASLPNIIIISCSTREFSDSCERVFRGGD